jgi:hypothetical protein
MAGIEENCDLHDVDWSKEPLITLMDAAEYGEPKAKLELSKRQAQIERDIATLGDNAIIRIDEIED